MIIVGGDRVGIRFLEFFASPTRTRCIPCIDRTGDAVAVDAGLQAVPRHGPAAL